MLEQVKKTEDIAEDCELCIDVSVWLIYGKIREMQTCTYYDVPSCFERGSRSNTIPSANTHLHGLIPVQLPVSARTSPAKVIVINDKTKTSINFMLSNNNMNLS